MYVCISTLCCVGGRVCVCERVKGVHAWSSCVGCVFADQCFTFYDVQCVRLLYKVDTCAIYGLPLVHFY